MSERTPVGVEPPARPVTVPQERLQTDESLLSERQKTDDELDKRHAVLEEGADAAVEQARESADAALEDARTRVDDTLEHAGTTSGQDQTLRQERAQEDAVLERERLTIDEQVTDEREERTRALASLLRLEREQTDERLLIERARGDAALAARDDFLVMVSHELRNLLGGIALSAETQVRFPADGEAGQRSLRAAKRIQRFAAGMNRLIGDLVDVASIEAGRLAIASGVVDANEVIRETLEAFRQAASTKGILLRTTAADGSLRASFDHERILQVLANLVSNAIKFTGERGTISIEVESREDQLRFSVTDTGAGIAPDQLAPIFERFWQATRGDRRGLGLGLYISRCIVEAHGGRLWVESAVGEGSTFSFVLPAASPSSPPPAPQ